MSFGTTINRLVTQKNIRSMPNYVPPFKNTTEDTVPWVRPSDWLTLPVPTSSEQKFVGLHAIFPTSNFCSVLCAGAYTVDWGDGTVENFAANAQAYHEYNYDTYDVSNTTLCSRGYKQAIVTITPQAGNNLTTININKKHSKTNLQQYCSGFLDINVSGPYATSLAISGSPQAVRMGMLERVNVINHATTNWGYMFYNCLALQDVNIAYGNLIVTASYMFYSCYALQSIPLFDTSNCTNMTSMFQYCNVQTVPRFDTSNCTNMTSMFANNVSLTTVPLFNTAKVINMTTMFSGCNLLRSVPLFDTSKVTSMSSMFTACYSLTSVPLFNTVLCTNMSSMFQNCYNLTSCPPFNTPVNTNTFNMFSGCFSLVSVPLFDTSKVTNMSGMFQNCYSLAKIPLYNTNVCTNLSGMFQNCYSLLTIPALNTATNTSMSNMFQNCYSLQSVPLLNASACTNMDYAFYNCYSLQSVPLLNTSGVTSAIMTFYNCYSLQSIPALNFSSVTTITTMLGLNYNLADIRIYGLKASGLSYASCKLSTTAIKTALANLGSSTTAKTVAVSTNHGLETAITKAATLTSGSSTIAITNTSSLTVGMPVLGSLNLPYNIPKSGSLDCSTNTLTITGHGIKESTPIAVRTDLSVQETNGTPPVGAPWACTASSGTKTVIIAGYNTNSTVAASSTNGSTWTARTMPASLIWTSVAYGNGTFVAVSTPGTNIGAYSTDGDTWTQSNLSVAGSWSCVAYGNGTFVAVDNNYIPPRIVRSPDGINWTNLTATGISSNNWASITYGNGKFVAVAGQSYNLTAGMVSSDNGLTWTNTVLPAGQWQSVAYGNGLFVALAANGNTAISSDGVTWTAGNSTNGGPYCSSITYGGDRFIVTTGYSWSGGSPSASMPYSLDGINWRLRTLGSTQYWAASCYDGNRFVLLAGRFGTAQSTDAVAFNSFDNTPVYYAKNVTTDTLQLSTTPGGSVYDIPGTLTYPIVTIAAGSYITAINPNVSITIGAPVNASGAATLTFYNVMDPMPALMKNWTITF